MSCRSFKVVNATKHAAPRQALYFFGAKTVLVPRTQVFPPLWRSYPGFRRGACDGRDGLLSSILKGLSHGLRILKSLASMFPIRRL